MAAVRAATAEFVGYGVRHHDLAQVAQVDRARRADAGGAHQPGPAAAFALLDHPVRCGHHPIALLHGHGGFLRLTLLQMATVWGRFGEIHFQPPPGRPHRNGGGAIQ
ncbi:hypothetical protein K353_04364 [Kitasatospora sp. SolWspMP-SS2h]|uniref:hypothetical protein n=1 Tax=Kitasatospora sp. SolWspMP-SS2h TaxID=1305729 RepID=UPI000DBF6228|nr:hypothetical protein [Kitasatospora sp. SolWspMP-SS2h]RAJ38427.1 hypothetical protein K353_04364 [Kitasatospora sp. SolWspMP-SS2h]